MSRGAVIALILGIVGTATLITVLCILLIPEPSINKNNYEYIIGNDGNITWQSVNNKSEKFRITSSVFQYTNDDSGKETGTLCGKVSFSITEMESLSTNTEKCWTVNSSKNTKCPLNETIQVKDCFYMKTQSGKTVYWFGGAEMVTQKWPINDVNLEKPTIFLSSDLPFRHGNVLERYYVSSLGTAIYIYPNSPLYVSVHPNDRICIEAGFESENTPSVGPVYLKDPAQGSSEIFDLFYVVCMGESTPAVHQLMTNRDNGLIRRPSDLPDLKMLQDPIWSTWARYKAAINQTIVEQYALEIVENNFTNSQLEIDDGYETYYGDFTFDPTKFPNAKEMIVRLHDLGFRVTNWVTPFINLDSPNFETGKSKSYFIPDENGEPSIVLWWNGRGAPIDFTNPNAAKWYKDILNNVKSSYGIDSFKFDAGEITYLPKWGLTYSFLPSLNPGDYTTAYSKIVYEIGGPIAEMRSSWKTQEINFFMRLMDKGSSWDYSRGFQTVIPTALTFSIIGYPFVLPDMIGGNAYILGRNSSGIPERELYIRWIELGAFLPCMQFSISPWQYDGEVTAIAQKYVEIHRTVVYEEIVKAAKRYISGEMSLLVSPIWFYADPDDQNAFSINDEFMVGDRYLVAPIVEKGSTVRRIYLPGSTSIRWKDKMRNECKNDFSEDAHCIYSGGTWLTYNIPLDEISWWERLTK